MYVIRYQWEGEYYSTHPMSLDDAVQAFIVAKDKFNGATIKKIGW